MTTATMPEATRSTPAALGAAPTENRRAFPRRKGKGTASCRPSKGITVAGVPATIMDISHGGIRLAIRDPFPVGEWLEVELTPMFGHGTVTRTAEVRWVHTTADGKTQLGCAWRHRLNFEELQKFL